MAMTQLTLSETWLPISAKSTKGRSEKKRPANLAFDLNNGPGLQHSDQRQGKLRVDNEGETGVSCRNAFHENEGKVLH